MSILRPIVFVALFALATSEMARADSPTVTAVLSNSEAAVGQMVQMEIKVSGANNVQAPDMISADGLEIHQTGTSRQFEMHNFSTNSSVVYNYTVLPLKTGTFKIPAQTVRAGGTSLRTPELTLHVVASTNQRAAPNSTGGNQANIDTSKLVNAELVIPKKSAYVGETIPVVVRLLIGTRLSALEPPEITGQGFTMQKLQGTDQPQIEEINGRQWQVYTFKTAIAPVRPGKLEIGPVKANARIVVPTQQRRNSRSRSPFDIFNMDDPFNDPFFADPFGRLGERREVAITSEPAALEVKPLPPNPPANFGGAVGNFTMNLEANPKSVQTGDPITVRSTITGRGNFDRLNAPALEDENGWHKYPPNSKFEKDDEVGISGTKSFEMVISPNEKKSAIPPLVFSYFDPTKEKYQTLRSEAIPVRVEGGAIATASATPAVSTATATPPRTATTTAAATPKPQDILYQLTERPAHVQSFVPLYARPNFWFAQIVPLLGLIGFVGWNIRQRRLGNREAQQTAALQHEASEAMRKLRSSSVPPREYLLNAARAVQLKTALNQRVDPNVVDADVAATAFHLDEHSRMRLRQLFQRSDEFRYSGAQNGDLSPQHRQETLELIEGLRT